MKYLNRTCQLFIVVFSSVLIASCDKDQVEIETSYIDVTIDGSEVIHSTNVDSTRQNFIDTKDLSINFYKKDNKYDVYALTISGIDFKNVKLPFVIDGPTHVSGDEPNFSFVLWDFDPAHSPGGMSRGLTSTRDHDITVTITSSGADGVKGTFSGAGIMGSKVAVFSAGAFQVKPQY